MNASAARELCVWRETALVGRLSEQGNVWQFVYDPAWGGGDLSPALPCAAGTLLDGGSQRPVQWFFGNLLPEEGARALLAQDAQLDAADSFGLLAWYGRESAGALTLLPPDAASSASGMEPLDDAELSQRIRDLPRMPLTHGAAKRMSLAGAQHKLAVILQGDTLFEPIGAAASTHILKPDHPQADDYWHTTINEWFVMNLARGVGLQTAEAILRRVPEPVYLTRRFDREGASPVRRLHALDGCQMLSLDAVFKYTQATVDALLALAELCRAKASTRQRLYQWWVFNLITGNSDAHLKNLSFIGTADGWVLAPHYDLICTSVYRADHGWNQDSPVTPNGVRYADIDRPRVLEIAAQMKIPPGAAQRELDRLRAVIPLHAQRLYESYLGGITGPAQEGEARLLRSIIHGPLQEMVARLA